MSGEIWRGPVGLRSAPYFSFERAAWIACAVGWDPETGEFSRLEGRDGFTTWAEAEDASQFLVRRLRCDPAATGLTT